MPYKVVFHIDWDDELALKMGLANINNLLKEADSAGSEIHMVANGQAVRLFRKEFAEEHETTINDLSAGGVRFCVCNNSLKRFKYKSKDMLEVCKVVPAGIAEICKLQAAGCAYIKP